MSDEIDGCICRASGGGAASTRDQWQYDNTFERTASAFLQSMMGAPDMPRSFLIRSIGTSTLAPAAMCSAV